VTKVIVIAVAIGVALSFFRERARGERVAVLTATDAAASAETMRARRGPAWLPEGPWFLAALALAGVAFLGFGFAETLPVDDRGRVVGIKAAIGAAVALLLAVRRPRDGFLWSWRATTATVAVLAAVAVVVSEGAGLGFGVVLLALAVAGFGGLALIILVAVGLSEKRTRLDALLAAALIAASIATFAVVDLFALRLESSAGDRMVAEAAALRADASIVEDTPGSSSPFVVAGAGRRLVAWELPSFSIGPSTTLLVHDPDDLLAGPHPPEERSPGDLNDCERVTGPWWTCTSG
jgi:hypothetical protein